MGNDNNNIMQVLAKSLDLVLNPDSVQRVGFALLVFPFDGPEGARTNWVSNAERNDMICGLKELVARFEGQPEMKGHA